MSLNPSNAISARITGKEPFENMAGVGKRYPQLADNTLATELRLAGITVVELPERYGEPQSIIEGELFGWKFRRAWYYWMASGPGIPFEAATKLHETNGKSVRVNGNCGCPSPAEQGGGPVTSYHVDNQDGLNALAVTIRSLNKSMPDLSKFRTAHQLAKDLLAGPDHIVILPTPMFDMPGRFTAFPAMSKVTKVEDTDAVAILPDLDAMPKEPENKPPEGAPDAGHA